MSKKNRSSKRIVEDKTSIIETNDSSPYIYQDGKLKEPVNIRERYKPTEKLSVITETALDRQSKLIMIDGFWGTAKTGTAVLTALKLLNNKTISKILYIRNPIESTSTGKVGLLPGSLEERMAPYNAVFYDKLNEFLSKPDIDRLEKENRLECLPISFLQGKTFNCCAVIIDEAASMSYDDIMLAISRIGERCKVFLIGDSTFQLTIGNKSGFRRFFTQFDDQESKDEGIYTFELRESSDILRSGLIRFIMHKTGIIKYPNKINQINENNDWVPHTE